MYIIKNAWTSIIRNKGRNILIAIIILVIAAACAITLSIRNSANKIVTAYESKYNVEATIGTNREAMMESFKESSSAEDRIDAFNNIESLTVEEIETYGDSEYVSNYYYVYSLNMDAEDIEKATDNLTKETTTVETETNTTTWQTPPSGGRGPNMSGGQSTTSKKTTTTTEFINTSNGDFTIKGYNSYEAMSDFIDGNYKITEGEVSDDFTSNNCVISEELASLNDLEIGDTITLISPEDDDITYELTITGIYTESTDESSNMDNMFTSSANTIITNSSVVEAILALDEELTSTITPTFILTSKEVVDLFAEEVEEKGLNEYYTVTNNIETVESATKSITNIKTFATTFLIISLIIGSVVLLVLNMINIRERKYEIGVLRTIGMKKITLIGQFMFELLVVCLFGLLLGAGVGSLCSVNVANHLLEQEISNATEDLSNISNNFGFPNSQEMPSNENNQNAEDSSEAVNQDENNNRENKNRGFNMNNINGLVSIEQVDDINAVVDFKVLLQLLAIGIGLTAISSISACIAIQRFSPLTILKERS